MEIDVVVPTWNARALLEGCLQTLEEQTAPHTTIVVDNGSTDRTVERVRERFPAVRLVELRENHGFGPAVNRGVEAGTGEAVVLVNNDVECDPEFLERLVTPLGDPEVAMVAGVLLRPGRTHVDSYGLELDRTLAAFPRFAGELYSPELLHEEGLGAPSGGAAAYRRTAYEAAGGFDERLFAYMEDVDLALRIAAGGGRCAGARDAVGVHLGSATVGRRSRRQIELGGFARGYMLRKYGVLRSGPLTAVRAVAVEAAVVAGETVLSRNLAALSGRRLGWRAGTGTAQPVPDGAVNPRIGLTGSLWRRRRAL